MAYVYRHIRLDKNEPFYIGIGSDNRYYRANSKKGRSDFWHKMANLSEYRVEIMLDDITYDEAKEKEKEFISLYGRKNLNKGTLCNLTDGGDGMLGYVVPKENSDRLNALNRGRKHTEEWKQKMSLRIRGENHPHWGKKFSEESKLKMSLSRKGEKHFRFGKKMERSTADKIGLAQMRGKNHAARKVIDTISGQIFDCIKDAADYYKINSVTLSNYISGRRKNKTNLKYFNKNEYDYQENIIRN